MANAKVAGKGGQGGRLGHSNMEHSTHTEEVKQASRKRRRAEARNALLEEVQDGAPEVERPSLHSEMPGKESPDERSV